MSLRGQNAIIGYGETEFVKFRQAQAQGRDNWSEQVDAALLAIADAGIDKDEIDGLVSIPPLDESVSWSMDFAEYLQLKLRFLDTPYFGGGAGAAGLLHAAAAIATGLCKTVLLVGGSAMDPQRAGDYGREDAVAFERDFDTPYGPMGDNSAYALIKRRYQHEFGVCETAFARLVTQARRHAARFPNALLGQELTEEEVLASRMICDPLRKFEIVMPCVGGNACGGRGCPRLGHGGAFYP